MRRDDWIAWGAVLVGSALAASVLFLYFHAQLGQWMPTILPQVEEDTLYYLAQVKEVLDGHPALGNPFIRAYADASFPGLRLPVWITAGPGFLGADINTVFVINTFLYSIITGGLLFVLSMRISGKRRTLSACAAIVGAATLHNLLLRPAIMQTIYPAFILFLIALFSVLQKPREWKGYVFLTLTLTLQFYMYPYCWITAFTATGLLFLITAWHRDLKALSFLLLTSIGVLVLSIPQILTTLSLFHDPTALAINIRSGLVETHHVLLLTITNLKYTILLILVLLFVRLRRAWSAPEMLLVLIGLSLMIGATSNIVTGKEVDFETHFWRLEILMNVIALVILIPALFRKSGNWEKIPLGLATLALLFTVSNRTFIRANSFRYLRLARQTAAEHRSLQEYDRVFSYFRKQGVRNQTIAVPHVMSSYIPVYTENYVLMHFRAGLHVIPAEELLTRFLTSNVDRIDEAALYSGLDEYAGVGALRTADYINASGGHVQPMDLIGGKTFIQKALTEHAYIRNHYDQTLRSLDVTYVVIDALAKDNPRVPVSGKQVFHDGRFTIYHLA